MGFEIINKLRKEKGLTLKQLSDVSGVPLGTLNKIVNGITKDPTLETVFLLARALNCKVDDFDDDQIDDNLTSDNLDLLHKWNLLSNENKKKIIGMIELKLAEQEETRGE